MFYLKPLIPIFAIWLLSEITIVVFQCRKTGKHSKIIYDSAVNTFIMYLIALFLLTVFFARSSLAGINLIPFYDLMKNNYIPYDMAEDYVLNVLLFVPFGFLLPYLKKTLSLKQTVLCCFLLTLCIECLQLIFKRGIFDIDDLICNTAGGLIGGLIVFVFRAKKASRKT